MHLDTLTTGPDAPEDKKYLFKTETFFSSTVHSAVKNINFNPLKENEKFLNTFSGIADLDDSEF